MTDIWKKASGARRMAIRASVLGLAVLAAGCETALESNEIKPAVGVGTSIETLKKSPCACAEIPMIIPSAMG